MKSFHPHAGLTDALIRLRAANDRLAKHLAKDRPKSIPPSPWEKAVVELHKYQPVRR